MLAYFYKSKLLKMHAVNNSTLEKEQLMPMMSKAVTTTVITVAHTYKTHDCGWGYVLGSNVVQAIESQQLHSSLHCHVTQELWYPALFSCKHL